MATIVDVARLAGVSTSTVSHVLNGTRPVRPDTRRRVVAAIDETGYRQDPVARAMRRARTDTIGLVVSDAGEPAFAEMVHGVEHKAAAHGLTLLLASSAEDPEREERAVTTLLARRVDGLIVARCASSKRAVDARLGDERSRPVVLLDRVFDNSPHDQVGADNRETMRRLVEHLRAAGHRRFLLVAGDQRVPTLVERRHGFRDATPDADLGDQTIVDAIDPPTLRAEVTAAIRARNVSCIIAASTPLAVVSLECLRDSGLTTPEQLAFATFDGFSHSDLFHPAITTVRQPAFEMGEAAVSLLLDRLTSPHASPRTLRLNQRLELRESTELHHRPNGTGAQP